MVQNSVSGRERGARLTESIRRRTAARDQPSSLAAQARAARWKRLVECFPDLEDMTVIDLGGTVEGWFGAPVIPKQLVMVNPSAATCLGEATSSHLRSFEILEADACILPTDMHGQFDMAFSNSVIEHVGGHDRRTQFAYSVSQLAPRYWVQTPYRYFPIEPHVLFPFFQQMPTRIRAEIRRRWIIGWGGRHGMTLDEAVADILTVELLDRTQLRYYFPDADFLDERFFGLRKSVIAVRRSSSKSQSAG